MTLEQFYAAAGGELNEVLQRIPSRAFLLKMLNKFAEDPSKAALDRAVEAGNTAEAFRAVHTMKGVTLTLGLAGLAAPCIALTEALRSDDFGAGWEDSYQALCTQHGQVLGAIREIEP